MVPADWRCVRQRTDRARCDPYAAQSGCAPRRREISMLETIAILLLILWLLGMVSAHTFGGFIHVLLVIAVVVVLVRIIRGRNPV
jgi:hypothetical protein